MNLKDKNEIFLVLILLFAFYLRICGLGYGFPYVLNLEEEKLLKDIFYVIGHMLTPDDYHASDFFLYASSIFVCILSRTFDLNNVLSLFGSSPETFIVPLRVVNMFFTIITIVVVYLIGRIFNPLCGLVSSAALAVSFLNVIYSHSFNLFPIMTFFMVLSTMFVLLACLNLKKAEVNLKLSFISVLLSTSIHYLGIMSIVPGIIYLTSKNNLKPWNFLKLLFLAFVLLNPSFIYHFFPNLIIFFKSYFMGYLANSSNSYMDCVSRILPTAVGPVILALPLLLFKYREKCDAWLIVILFSFPFMYFLLLGLLHLKDICYSLPLIPYLSIAFGLVFSFVYSEIEKKVHWKRFVFIFVSLLAFWIPLKSVLNYNKLINLPDTRALATEWILRKTTRYFTIAWDDHSIEFGGAANFFGQEEREKKNKKRSSFVNERKKIIVDSSFLKQKDWFKILKKRADYVVVSSLDSESAFRSGENKLFKKYYKKLSRLNSEVSFNPYYKDVENKLRNLFFEDLYLPFETVFQRERFGPVVRVYKI